MIICPRKAQKPRNKSTYCIEQAVERAARVFYGTLNCLNPLARTARPTVVPSKNQKPVLYLFEYFRAFCAFRGQIAS